MLNDLELTILSMVAEGARYGHELQTLIETRELRQWLTIGSSSAYYILAKLERQDLLTSQRDKDNDPAQAVYTITEAGRGVLQTAVNDLLREPRSFGAGVELGLANLNVLKPHQVFHALMHRMGRLRAQLAATESAWTRMIGEAALTDSQRAMYTHGLTMMRAELEWLEAFAEDWKTRYPAVEREAEDEAPDEQREVPPHAAPTIVHQPTKPKSPMKQAQQINPKDRLNPKA